MRLRAPYPILDEIIKISEAEKWEKAILEWKWTDTFFIGPKEIPVTCLCGHYPIRECCVITNKKNGATAIVGNCCINKFMNTESDFIFQAIKRVSRDITKSLNIAAINYANEKGMISHLDYEFYKKIWRKRELSTNDALQKRRINEVILSKFKKKWED